MKTYSSLQRTTLIWLLWGPYQLLRMLLAASGDDAWAEYEDEIVVLRDVFGRETYLVPDSISGAKAHAGPFVAWDVNKWRQMDEAMEALFAWTPVTDGVQHVVIFRRKVGKTLSGYRPAPTIQDSS